MTACSFLLCFERHAIAREQHVCLCEQGSQASTGFIIAMHKGNAARVQGRSVPGEFCSIGVSAQAILGHLTMDGYLLSTNFERVPLVLCYIQQPLAGRLLVLVTGNQDGGIGLRDEPGRVPGAWPACEHTAAGNNARRRASKDALAVTLITDKGHVGSRKREIALANLALQARRERLRQKQVGIADAPYQPIHVDREVRNLALLLRRL